jgi:hypothetical protein
MKMDFLTIIATATRSLEMVKALKDIDKQIGEAELKARAAELLSNLADLKVALVEAKEEAAVKDGEIAKLKKAFQLRNDCVRHYKFLVRQKFRRCASRPTLLHSMRTNRRSDD